MAFQSIVPVQLGQAAIGTTVSTLYTVPAATRTFVKDLDIANTSPTAISVTVYLVPNAGTAGPSNVLIPGMSVPANGILQWTGSQILPTGATIQVLASALGATITASGGEAV